VLAQHGWHTPKGLFLGEDIPRITDLHGLLDWRRCIGYNALSAHEADVVWSIYTFHESVYGFALTAPSEPVCQ